ncbi:MAG: ABC transporter ATP-binding protein [Rhodospirillales bacterium]|nr:ABC transporter ATP-binding protein [Rhodospirillales bacterium]
MAGIRIENLVVGYGTEPVISSLSLEIADGTLFTLLGPSGCGKTTLLRTIAGFVPVRAGKLAFGNRDVTHRPAYLRDIGMVFQDYALFPDKSVYDNVAYGLRARRVDETAIKTTVSEYLERVGLSAFAQRLPAALSGGQRQRVALARALAIKPTVLLMDEPLSNLDAKLRVQVRETIADLQREVGITTVLVTHDQEEALALSDRIGLLRMGRLEQVGTPEDLYARPVSAYVADFVGAANILPVEVAVPTISGASAQVRLDGMSLEVLAPTGLPAGAAILVARGETLSLGAASGATTNAIRCTVRRRQYLGGRTSFRVATDAGRDIVVEAHGAAPTFAVGDKVSLRFDPVRTLVVAS